MSEAQLFQKRHQKLLNFSKTLIYLASFCISLLPSLPVRFILLIDLIDLNEILHALFIQYGPILIIE